MEVFERINGSKMTVVQQPRLDDWRRQCSGLAQPPQILGGRGRKKNILFFSPQKVNFYFNTFWVINMKYFVATFFSHGWRGGGRYTNFFSAQQVLWGQGHAPSSLPFFKYPLDVFCRHDDVNPNDDESDCDSNNDISGPDSHLEDVGHQECLTRQLLSQKQAWS